VFDRAKAEISGNELSDNETAIRLGARAQITIMSDNRISRSHLSALHVTRLPLDSPLDLVQLQERNHFEANAKLMELTTLIANLTDTDVTPEVSQAVQQRICTFTLTGTNYHRQKVFRCDTCRLNGNRGACVVCAETCHAGHQIREDRPQDFYCDCGAEKFCSTLAKGLKPESEQAQEQ